MYTTILSFANTPLHRTSFVLGRAGVSTMVTLSEKVGENV